MFSIILCLLSVLTVQQDQPAFKGGAKSLNDFLTRSLIYPEFSKQNCLQGTIEVGFSLTKTGKIFKSTISKGFGTDLDAEALRIVRLTSGKWEVPPGYDTTSVLLLPVTFSLANEQKCQGLSRDEINAAITAYHSYEGLTRAVLNFYDNKLAGKYDASQETKILELKQQLGYDDKFIDRLLKQASGKLKQGDREGACDDLNFIRRIGSDRADKLIAANCGSLQIK